MCARQKHTSSNCLDICTTTLTSCSPVFFPMALCMWSIKSGPSRKLQHQVRTHALEAVVRTSRSCGLWTSIWPCSSMMTAAIPFATVGFGAHMCNHHQVEAKAVRKSRLCSATGQVPWDIKEPKRTTPNKQKNILQNQWWRNRVSQAACRPRPEEQLQEVEQAHKD